MLPQTLRLLAAALCGLACLAPLPAQTTENGFEGGSIYPFKVEVAGGKVSEVVTPAGFSARAGSKVWRASWNAANYIGTRSTRGVECQSASNGLARIAGEGWYAYSIYLPPDFPAKNVSLGQIIAWDQSQPNTDKTIVLVLKPNRVFEVAGYSGSTSAVEPVTIGGKLT